MAAVGTGIDRISAERNALANLVARFGQSIQVDQSVSTAYNEVVKSGAAAAWSESTSVQDNIVTSSSMDNLVAVENKEYWFNAADNTHYAAAVMDKAMAARLYSGMINDNLTMINNLTNMTNAEKNTLEGFSRYQFAAMAADINNSYANILKVLASPVPEGVKDGHELRMEAAEIAGNIPVGVSIRGDRQNRISGAFSKAVSGLGFRTGGTNSRYIIDGDLKISEVQLNNPNKFARYEVSANLIDTGSGRAVLVPYNINGREGHATLSEAENRALAAAEKKIGNEYFSVVQEYLSRALPKK
jgi:hypothetical protein